MCLFVNIPFIITNIYVAKIKWLKSYNDIYDTNILSRLVLNDSSFNLNLSNLISLTKIVEFLYNLYSIRIMVCLDNSYAFNSTISNLKL